MTPPIKGKYERERLRRVELVKAAEARFADGETFKDIANDLGVHKTFLYGLVRRWRETGETGLMPLRRRKSRFCQWMLTAEERETLASLCRDKPMIAGVRQFRESGKCRPELVKFLSRDRIPRWLRDDLKKARLRKPTRRPKGGANGG
jgi:transposase